MDFPELISGFAGRHGVADLAAEDNAAASMTAAWSWAI